MWLWILIATAILSALFFIVLLAQFEAGRKVQSKWVMYFLCSLTVMMALLIFNPKSQPETIGIMPPPNLSAEPVVNENNFNESINNEGTLPQTDQPFNDDMEQQDIKTDDNTSQKPDVLSGEKEMTTNQEEINITDPILQEIEILKQKAMENKNAISAETPPAGSLPQRFNGAEPYHQDSLYKAFTKIKPQPQQQPVKIDQQPQANRVEADVQVEEEKPDVSSGEKEITVDQQDMDAADPILEEMKMLKQQAMEKKNAVPSETPSAGSLPKSSISAEPYHQDPLYKAFTKIKPQPQQQPVKTDQQPQASKIEAEVQAGSLNLRDNGSLSAPVVATLKMGDIVEVLTFPQEGEWAQVRLVTGEEGWVNKQYLSIRQ